MRKEPCLLTENPLNSWILESVNPLLQEKQRESKPECA